jgi:hypothetical protein
VTDSIAPGDVRVTTRYNPATNTRGSSVTAQANGRQLTIPYPHEAHDAHEAAARALLAVLYADDPGRVERVTLRLDAQRSRGFVYVASVAPDGAFPVPDYVPPDMVTADLIRHLAGALRLALHLSDDTLRVEIASQADGLDEIAAAYDQRATS